MIDITKQTVLKGQHEVERYTFGSHMIFKLSSLESILNMYQNGLNCCCNLTLMEFDIPQMNRTLKKV